MTVPQLETVGVQEAALLLRISPDALMRKARAGLVPGAKIGRQWVFVRIDLVQLIRDQAQTRARSSIANVRLPVAGSVSAQSAMQKLDAALARLSNQPLKSTKASREV